MTFAIKFNGRASSVGGTMRADYECPDHGRFEALVERDLNGDPPAFKRCPAIVTVSGASGTYGGGLVLMSVIVDGPVSSFPASCACRSPWRVSMPAIHTQFVVSATQGKAAPKPNPGAMDTRPLAEGRKNEYRAAREKLREERRHARVKELLK